MFKAGSRLGSRGVLRDNSMLGGTSFGGSCFARVSVHAAGRVGLCSGHTRLLAARPTNSCRLMGSSGKRLALGVAGPGRF